MLTEPASASKTLCDAATQRSVSPEPDLQDFNLCDLHHLELLREWSRVNWPTIKKSIESYNPVIYHECCFCFSRRGFSKKSGHSDLQSASILRMPSLKTVSSPEELYKWLLDKLKYHHKLGRRLVFPAINRYHCELESPHDELERQIELLSKRCESQSKQLEDLHQENVRLRSDNQRLLESSQSWCTMYYQSQELLDKNKIEPPSPVKARWGEEGGFFTN